jgi:hypothetical protein
MNRIKLPLIALSLIIAGCGLLTGLGTGINNFDSNGASIFYTGNTSDGEAVPYSGGTFTGMMMSRKLSCASCHGTDGQGGLHLMHMQVMDAPDIRLSTLEGESHESGIEEEDHSDLLDEYDIDTFRQAVVDGEHPDGTRLDRDMPRWKLTDQDLEDLFAFLQTLE